MVRGGSGWSGPNLVVEAELHNFTVLREGRGSIHHSRSQSSRTPTSYGRSSLAETFGASLPTEFAPALRQVALFLGQIRVPLWTPSTTRLASEPVFATGRLPLRDSAHRRAKDSPATPLPDRSNGDATPPNCVLSVESERNRFRNLVAIFGDPDLAVQDLLQHLRQIVRLAYRETARHNKDVLVISERRQDSQLAFESNQIECIPHRGKLPNVELTEHLYF